MQEKHFKKLDEGFVCENCGKTVPPLGYTSRNHCPFCLHSKHVDDFPGDRSNDCRGVMKPIALETNAKKGYIIVFKCKKCNEIKRNKAADDDCFEKLLELNK